MQRTMPSSISCAYERPKVSLSCLQCQQRKRKCDKNSPCQACSQACITCTPISRARLPRGRHAIQQGNGDLRQRVARLEKLLSNQKDAEEQVIPTPPQTDSPISHSTWNTISEEFVGIRELLDTLTGDEPDDSLVEAAETDRSQSFDLLLYGDASCFVQPHVLESPPMGMVSALVEIYLHRVDQVFKITHAPSLRAVMLRDDNRTPAQEALRFTLFFTAVNTLSEQECLQHFDSSKNSLSSRFQLAAEVMLSRAELLTTTDLTTLQAFLIYLVGLRAHNGSRAASALLATAVRIGQSLGLERETAGHTPFETELRRRIWYSIGILDLQISFDNGSCTAFASGILLGHAPLNINDADISPDDFTPPRERSTCTEMSFCCATHEMLRQMRRMIHTPRDVDGQPLIQQDWAQRYAIAEDCARSLKGIHLTRCNDVDPFQLYTKAVCEGMVVTLRLLVRRPMYRFQSSKPSPDDDFNVLDVAADVLDHTLQKASNKDFEPWQWFAWLKWYALAVLLAELCGHTEGLRVDKAWVIAEASFVMTKKLTHDPVLWGSMEKLMRKARAARASNGTVAGSGSIPTYNDQTPLHFDGHEAASYHMDYKFSRSDTHGSSEQHENPWEELELDSWVNWESFIQDLGAPVQLDTTNGYH